MQQNTYAMFSKGSKNKKDTSNQFGAEGGGPDGQRVGPNSKAN